MDYWFSTCVKFSKKLTFLNPLYVHVLVLTKGYEKFVFRKISFTYYGPFPIQQLFTQAWQKNIAYGFIKNPFSWTMLFFIIISTVILANQAILNKVDNKGIRTLMGSSFHKSISDYKYCRSISDDTSDNTYAFPQVYYIWWCIWCIVHSLCLSSKFKNSYRHNFAEIEVKCFYKFHKLFNISMCKFWNCYLLIYIFW